MGDYLRMFNGQPFKAFQHGRSYHKGEAKTIAKQLRSGGCLARTTKEATGWVVWWRKK